MTSRQTLLAIALFVPLWLCVRLIKIDDQELEESWYRLPLTFATCIALATPFIIAFKKDEKSNILRDILLVATTIMLLVAWYFAAWSVPLSSNALIKQGDNDWIAFVGRPGMLARTKGECKILPSKISAANVTLEIVPDQAVEIAKYFDTYPYRLQTIIHVADTLVPGSPATLNREEVSLVNDRLTRQFGYRIQGFVD